MPVVNFTTKRELPRIGKLRIGYRNEKGYPVKSDRIITRTSDDNILWPDIEEAYGANPSEIGIIVPSNEKTIDGREAEAIMLREDIMKKILLFIGEGLITVSDFEMQDIKDKIYQIMPDFVNYPIMLKRYGAKGKLLCSGNGILATEFNIESGEKTPKLCPCHFNTSDNKCKPIGLFSFFVEDVKGIGVYTIQTSSYHSTQNINNVLEILCNATDGRIMGLPLKLRVVDKKASPLTPKGIINTKIHVWWLHSDLTIQELSHVARTKGFLEGDVEPEDKYLIGTKGEIISTNGEIIEDPGYEVSGYQESDLDFDPNLDMNMVNDPQLKPYFDKLNYVEDMRKLIVSKYPDKDVLIPKLEQQLKNAGLTPPKAKGKAAKGKAAAPKVTPVVEEKTVEPVQTPPPVLTDADQPQGDFF